MRALSVLLVVLGSWTVCALNPEICEDIANNHYKTTKFGSGGQGRIKLIETVNGKYVEKVYENPKYMFREYQITKEMDHPAVMKPVCMLSERRLVMPYYPDGTLRNVYPQVTSYEDRRLYAAQLISGMFHIHDNNKVHLDLKPANVMLSGKQLVIIDFGLGRRVEDISPGPGTRDWQAPEMRVYKDDRHIRADGRRVPVHEGMPLHEGIDWWGVGLCILAMNSEGWRLDAKKLRIPRSIPDEIVELIELLTHKNPDLRRFVTKEDRDIIRRLRYFQGIDWNALKFPPSSRVGGTHGARRPRRVSIVAPSRRVKDEARTVLYDEYLDPEDDYTEETIYVDDSGSASSETDYYPSAAGIRHQRYNRGRSARRARGMRIVR